MKHGMYIILDQLTRTSLQGQAIESEQSWKEAKDSYGISVFSMHGAELCGNDAAFAGIGLQPEPT